MHQLWLLHRNPAREFYAAIGATAMDEWIPYRIAGENLRRLAAPVTPPAADVAAT